MIITGYFNVKFRNKIIELFKGYTQVMDISTFWLQISNQYLKV